LDASIPRADIPSPRSNPNPFRVTTPRSLTALACTTGFLSGRGATLDVPGIAHFSSGVTGSANIGSAPPSGVRLHARTVTR